MKATPYNTYADYLRTPQFRWICSVVRERSRGICERCHRRPATDPHHRAYCRWGEFDSPDNLEDLCHECHCDAHRCVSCGRVKLKARHIKASLQKCDHCRGVI